MEQKTNVDIKENNSIPKALEGITNESFHKMYKDIASRYGNNFDAFEIGIIKILREDGYKEFKGNITPTIFAVIRNRMDKGIFEHRIPEFEDLDKLIIRKITNANTQRQFREVALKLKEKFNKFSEDEKDIIVTEFKNAKKTNDIPNFDKIFNKIQGLRAKAEKVQNEKRKEIEISGELGKASASLDDLKKTVEEPKNIWKTNSNEKESSPFINIMGQNILGKIDDLKHQELPPYFQNMKKDIFDSDEDLKKNQEALEICFNSVARDISNVVTFPLEDGDEQVQEILKNYLKGVEQGEDPEITSKTKEEIIALAIKKRGPNNWNFDVSKRINIDDLKDEADKKIIELEKDEEFKKNQKIIEEESIMNGEDFAKATIYKKILEEKLEKEGKLTDREWETLINLNMILGGISEFIKLYEIEENEKDKDKDKKEAQGKIINKASTEVLEGNINSLDPDLIVLYNNEIHDYIFKKDANEYDKIFDKNISLKYRKILYKQLVEEHKGDKAFQESIKYLDEYGNIDEEKVQAEHIDEESIKKNHTKINKMIEDLAEKEFHDKEKFKDINNICTKRCIMSTCFRALSAYFDTSNNNGENFASEFEIKDINENIGFNEESGIIKMTGTIGGSNHIGLYYDTKKGELSFDNFIGFDSNIGYILGTNNGIKEKINIKLPTMEEMENQCDNVNKDIIHSLTINTPQYIKLLSKTLKESLRLGCFQGFIGTDIDVNKQFVKEFNEKNILKQEIFKSIYNKYYDEGSIQKINEDKLVISEGNSKEQYKLIKLISDSIDSCNNANELLKFRNLITEFDKIIGTDSIYLKKDILLYTLFANNRKDNHDLNDQSLEIMDQENLDITTDKSKSTNYESDFQIPEDTHKSLNYYTFLDLISEDHGTLRTINLDCFDYVINTIKKEGTQLLDKKEGLLWTNYLLKVVQGELPDITNIGNEI